MTLNRNFTRMPNPRVTHEPLTDKYSVGLRETLIQLKPNPDYHITSGHDGIIYIGGGKYWTGILVGIRMLRDLGCTLPIEVWYRPDAGETVHPEQTEGMNVYYGQVPGDGGKHGGWAAKLYAMYHTSLEKVLYLDADAYCVNDPTPLFGLLKDYPFIYWQDLIKQQWSIKWKHVLANGDMKHIPPVQGGQLLINRESAWKLVHACKYMCDNRDHYFRYMYGDQDTWRVALAADACEYGTFGKAHWIQSAFICSHLGTPYVVHRCQGKLFRLEDIPTGNLKYSVAVPALPKETEVFKLLSDILNADLNSIKAFSDIYERKLWGPYTHIGGSGSRMGQSRDYVNFIREKIVEKGYRKIVDLGCSDGSLSIELHCPEYVGYDCVPSAVESAQKKYEKFINYTFVHLDFYKECDIIHSGDMLLCKDVLHHWPNEMVKRFLDKLIQLNRWKEILITVDKTQQTNGQDTYLGGFRGLDITKQPLNEYPFTKVFEFKHKAVYSLNIQTES